LISRAGSLTNLAKFPASTIQILGAEKALFRALKTHTKTPKYGLLFHSTYIGRAVPKNKGRISRFLANKCAIASRIDCFSEVPVATFGEFLKQQVEERLSYFETGNKPRKNLDVMVEAAGEAETTKVSVCFLKSGHSFSFCCLGYEASSKGREEIGKEGSIGRRSCR
jgi:RNA processing factor Prp31